MEIEQENGSLPLNGKKESKGSDNLIENEMSMDYESADSEQNEGQRPDPAGTTVGLMGGQPKDDESGLDVSQYTGPHSKGSGQFIDPKAPWHTGPSNSEETNDQP